MVFYADVVLQYFANGASPTLVPEPYGSNGGVPPATQQNGNGQYTVEPVSPNVILGSPPPSPVIGDNPQVDWLALPLGSYVTVGFINKTIVDGPGNDIFIQSFDREDSADEDADIYISANGADFVFLGRVNELGTQALDLASIGFTQPVQAIRVLGVDNKGTSPGFDLISVQALQVESAGERILTGTDNSETIVGGNGNDTLTGNGGNDKIVGSLGNDLISGGGGNDRINCGSGNDRVNGGLGNDRIVLGRGQDICEVVQGLGVDVVTDFRVRQDRIDLPAGVRVRSLNITQQGRNTSISVGGDQLAVLVNVRSTIITAVDFI
jgi:Ca2+-binding RTX toxin-like protein